MNVLFVLSDQHNAAFSGCYGHPMARTPNIDAIARRGTRFASAYSLSPLCVPGRAAMFSGRYVHELPVWDNTLAYNGTPGSWGRHLRDHGVKMTSVGKLDFAPGFDHGIEEELMGGHRHSMDICALFRDQQVPRKALHMALRDIRPRTCEEPPTNDMKVRDRAIQWLREDRPKDRPWVLQVNFLAPHPGWRPRQDIWSRYENTIKDLPAKYWQSIEELHPANRAFSIHSCGEEFSRQDVLRCHEAYLAVIEELDEYVGSLLHALETEGIADDTLVIYGSDHGELAHAHCAWTKCSMYEDSIRVPWVMAGPGVPAGHVESTCVSHLDLFPTICDALDLPPAWDKRGVSLLGPDRPGFVMSEFHGNGFPDSIFAIRCGKWKLVETANQRPQLYDLETDPDEMRDLLAQPQVAQADLEKLQELRRMLSSICSPQAVDARAKADQARLRGELEASGRLLEELAKRGFERRTDRLVNVEGAVGGQGN